MKYTWNKRLTKDTPVKLITRKGRRYMAVQGKVLSHKNGTLTIQGLNGKVFTRHDPQRIWLKEKMKTLTELIHKLNENKQVEAEKSLWLAHIKLKKLLIANSSSILSKYDHLMDQVIDLLEKEWTAGR